MDFKTSNEETKTGIYLLQDGSEEPFNIRLHLAKDLLTIQEQDVICVSGEPFYSSERTVTIRRQTIGGFGLSIKGGAEHKIPVVISKISKEQKAELSGLLFIGDGILQINGINVRSYRHEEVVQVLRNAGEEVTLTVSFLKRTPAFLKLPLCEDCLCTSGIGHAIFTGIPSDQSSGTSSPLCDSGLHLNYHPNNTDTLSCSSWPMSPGLRWEKRWMDLRLIPLLHARLSQYVPGSDICRQNAFQVIAVDGVCSGVIQCPSTDECTEWLQAIASNISALTKHNVKKINRNFPVNQQIIFMGWVDEKEQDSVQDRMYTPKFLALRGSSLFKFSAPPVTTWDWTRAEKSFTDYEIMFKILKDIELVDKRKHCFSVQTDSGEDIFFSVELECELLLWEKAFQMATFFEVERIQCKTYACIMDSHLMGLTIDFSMGFVCFDAATKAVLWRYKFSQLKGSSDDGKSKIKFLFQNPDTKLIEAKELEFSNLFAVLHCIHAFFAAKVACLDPMFVSSRNTTMVSATSTLTAPSQISKLKYTS
ncbi:gamma-1-syntrophin isoform X1 [Carassius gibelio]|uniref:gamma-1-syntrophin isoform X1 n=1 Tax=Carassius gibelio TaxID=101364 RepID=UPI00227974FF|nr:gamma-1-syntrophin isoform X1 [Carassius gibelio]XP_052451350.1 gamma-1-syntrophin isoform X1 [Carassius gibelio]XP_052451351.1 gamma-1-syntrophin isoform X1 [Carassius gibelio]